jgi:hypothetical protein
MFGKPSRHTRKKLEQHGRRATATVLDVGERGMAITHGSDNVVSNTEIALKLKLRVEPQDEPAFEVEERFRFAQLSIPTQGQCLAVIYDPNDHDAVMLDGNPAPNIAALMQGRGKSAGQIDFIQQLFASASSGAPTTETQAIAAQWAEQNGAMVIGPGSAGFGAPPIPSPPQRDPVELLSELVTMKDRGLLSDAEFAEQKARILGK